MSKHKTKNSGKVQVEIPEGAKYIMVFEHGNRLSVTTGGFLNFDEMMGFNRRVINANLTEQILLDAIQKQMTVAQSRQPAPPPPPKEEPPKKE